MTIITIDDIQNDLLGYLKRVAAGETLILFQADKPIAEIKPVASANQTLRPFGLCAGDFIVPDDFDVPFPEDVQLENEGRMTARFKGVEGVR